MPLIVEAANLRPVSLRRLNARAYCRAFTAVEIVIVVVALGILAMVVVPQFSRANQQSKQNQLKDVLQYVRTQVAVFKCSTRTFRRAIRGEICMRRRLKRHCWRR